MLSSSELTLKSLRCSSLPPNTAPVPKRSARSAESQGCANFRRCRPFSSVSEISHESREALQYAVDATYKSRFGPSPEQIRSDLIARLGRLNLELDTGQIGEWAEEISAGQRIQIRIQRGSRR